MAQKFTPWFPANVKPARPGVYQTNAKNESADRLFFSYFDGRLWYGEWWTEARAVSQPAIHQMPASELEYATRWRGLASPPASVSRPQAKDSPSASPSSLPAEKETK